MNIKVGDIVFTIFSCGQKEHEVVEIDENWIYISSANCSECLGHITPTKKIVCNGHKEKDLILVRSKETNEKAIHNLKAWMERDQ